MLEGKNILLGVCGSIASYKSAELTRLLVKAGANVKIVMTTGAKAFITPLTLSTLSKNPIFSEYYNSDTGEWNNHVELALWADLILIAPVTANTLAKFANGGCDNLLSACYLSAKCPIMFAPAMDLDMWKHPSTKKNIQTLLDYGNILIKPGKGELASGLSGEGRMEEPEAIYQQVIHHFEYEQLLKGKRILVTAGPTFEPIDPVRFIGNYSSGKMGFAIAELCAKLGASVNLISGPVALEVHHPNVKRINVTTAEEMLSAVDYAFTDCDACIMSAAVADYTPLEKAAQKIKKSDGEFNITLKKTTDILQYLGSIKKNQILVGFALETEKEEEHAKLKLQKKNLDFIVLNSLNDEGAGFKGDLNKVTIIQTDGATTYYDLKSKSEVAQDIINTLIKYL
ncbi:bifunctional phosphopantothenoylcysteine decarboxylase/phosphopantothenate--cysteine ligase CoaBC [Pedobacter puniceum]|uniref:Coenzyme A biosynthesis bifunctional protein CoaBC n=1 Tax=Pedobacter puniceum TaxID=2666136 RepID=A0A7K0FR38_9SPHI|nr:bifunctional phosphopantothenoylcysteine decarboxylase/phosphopantothenate--cysteine ligase CoaBC [Pedobacter puniceum]MRX48212.1 bifunctional phosphopantothenoylcysteine decarboxylase/phosphopantothenate--cysteine ligase CoaBC [Pedobacter puniceum]